MMNLDNIKRIKPTEKLPELKYKTLRGNAWPSNSLAGPLNLIVFYRGVQCSYCKKQIGLLNEKLPEFHDRGVEVIAISADNQERAEQAKAEWGLDKLEVGYDVDIEQAAELGLYISSQKRDTEMPIFTESGHFLVTQDNHLFAAWIQSYPHARPVLDDLLGCLDFIRDNQRPPRGEL